MPTNEEAGGALFVLEPLFEATVGSHLTGRSLNWPEALFQKAQGVSLNWPAPDIRKFSVNWPAPKAPDLEILKLNWPAPRATERKFSFIS